MAQNEASMSRVEPITTWNSGTLRQRRGVIASLEPEDAKITGMTRSLHRRLLALNVARPVGWQPNDAADRAA